MRRTVLLCARLVFFAWGLGWLSAAGVAEAHAARVLFVNPNESPAWSDFSAAMRAAADDLGMSLIEYRATEWPATMVEDIRALLRGPGRPDYLVITVHKGARVRLLELAEQEGVPVFIINSGLFDEDLARYGGPRQGFKRWIGQLLPDDEQAGFVLANLIVDAARQVGRVDAGGRVRLLAFGGNPTGQSARERNAGLMRAIGTRTDVRLLQLVQGNWSRSAVALKAPLAFERYPEVDAIWCANDPMAFGALDGLTARPIEARPFIGSIDWLQEALLDVRNGKLVATLGGHFLESAWAMVLLHDHFAGMDFATERVDFRSQLYPLTRANLDAYERDFSDRDWSKIDFAAFSKVHNPSLTRYDLSFGAVLAQRHAAQRTAMAAKP